MVSESNIVGMLAFGVINVLSCYIAGFVTYRYGEKLNVWSAIPWALLQISYGTMPFFGLWDELVGYDRYMDALSAFFSIMTMMFLISATIIDSKCCNIKWNLKHVLFYIFVIIPFWLILFLIPELHTISDVIYPICILPIGLLCYILMIYYLKQLNILCGIAGFILLLSLLMNIVGFLSRAIIDEENPARTYGWYLSNWLAVVLLFVLWCFVHIHKKLDINDKDQNGTVKDSSQCDEDSEKISLQV